jgi:hypothetical protein
MMGEMNRMAKEVDKSNHDKAIKQLDLIVDASEELKLLTPPGIILSFSDNNQYFFGVQYNRELSSVSANYVNRNGKIYKISVREVEK